MKVENIEVYGFRRAFYGMRAPLESWDKSDSKFTISQYDPPNPWHIQVPESPEIGPNDLKLSCKLIKGGSEHRKFLRQITIWFDITIPIYVWSELDTYKVATVRNSCSTMHKLGSRDLTQEDFQLPIDSQLLDKLNEYGKQLRQALVIKDTKKANEIRREYKNLLPSGYLQKATFMMSYETALSMYFQRRNHRLSEWSVENPESICSFIASLPYMKEFIEARK